ncbi:arylsulfatase J-like [Oscarella lobularis]|uniref:arylsulfatase J-like n=1 Tax=Oscarella lobularis TaxID=121494 RepID=UPI003313D585
MLSSLLLFSFFALGQLATKPPHILFIVADDLGWFDVGWHGAEIKTPVLDKLAREGVTLTQSYVQSVCTPTRGAIMSGRYPYHIGLQRGGIRPTRPYGLPLKITTIAQRLQTAGYSTHAIGKWHLGFCKWDYTPCERGFDTFFGFYGGGQDHYTHRKDYRSEVFNRTRISGLDFRRNRRLVTNINGTYSMEAFAAEAIRLISEHDKHTPMYMYLSLQVVHGPLQAPQRFVDMYKEIKNKNRQMKAAMVTAMDEAIGNITAALKKIGMWNDALIVFTTDNGGPVNSGSSNWPLRGSKATLWEGGHRGAAFVHGKMLHKTGYVYSGMIHTVDWYPTLLSLAGVNVDDTDLDGMNVWDAISNNKSSPRQSFVYNLLLIDETLSGGIRFNNWKLLVNPRSRRSEWYNPANASFPELFRKPLSDTLLFDLDADPTEHHNLASTKTDVLAMMMSRLNEAIENYVPDLIKQNPETAKSNPANFGDAWSPGWC